MTTITFDEDIKIEKTHFRNINEFDLNINLLKFNNKKLSPKEIIRKYKLNTISDGNKNDILNEINKLAYNI